MTPHDLLAAFETIAEAPDGVKRLRELVLQLAVTGRLVPSDGGLGSRTDKARIGWSTKTLNEIVLDLQNGLSSRGGDGGPPVVVLRLADIKNGKINDDGFRYIDATPAASQRYELRSGDVLAIRVNGSADLVGRFIQVERTAGWIYCDHMIRIRLGSEILPRFLTLFSDTPQAREQLAAVTVTTAGQRTVNQKGLGSLVVPIPPFAEQHRIVARVDELMGLLDQLESARNTRDEVRRAVRDAAFAALRDAEDAGAVRTAWARISCQMASLFTVLADILPLRQAILDVAVKGHLVEPETRFDSILLNDVVDPNRPVSYGVLVPGPEVEGGVSLVRIADLHPTHPTIKPEKSISPEIAAEFNRARLDGDELLMGVVGSIGKVGVSRPEWAGAVVARAVVKIGLRTGVCRDYVRIVLQSPHAQDYFREATRTLAQPTLNVGLIRKLPIRLYSLLEQHRIVAKVDALMALCDELEARLTAARDLQAQFAAAAVHHLDV